MTPLIYLSDPSMWTLPIGLYDFIGKFDAQWNLLMAASVLFILPPLAIFFLSQRVFVHGRIGATGINR